MKQAELIALGIAGLALYLIVKARGNTTTSKATATARPAGWVSEILDMGGKGFANDWRYFDNGVAIDPSGNYYQDGAMVWQAPGAGA